MARVLLINPPIYDFAAFDLWAKPLGLLYAAARLESLGHEVRVIDCLDRRHRSVSSVTGKHGPKNRRFATGSYYWTEKPKPAVLSDVPRIYKRFGIPEEALRREIESGPKPDVVGVTSAMTYWYPGVVEAVETARAVFGSVPVALGGIYATLCPSHAREAVRPDFLVTGPGEHALAGIVAEVSGEEPPPEEMPFSQLPNPAYHLLPHVESVAVLTGRGCPYRCSYCASGILAPRVERRTPESVVVEIQGYADNFGIRDAAFYDDALLWQADAHAKPILEQVAARRLGVRFHTPNGLQVRFIDSELARLMREAGFETVRLSLETVDPSLQSDWDDKVSLDEFLSGVEHLKNAGFTHANMGAYVMTGHPGEETEETLRSMAAAHSAGVAVRLAQYSPIPGTPQFERIRTAARANIDEPLLQNNTIMPAAGEGRLSRLENLKAVARALNDALAEGRTVIDICDIDGDIAQKLSRAGICI